MAKIENNDDLERWIHDNALWQWGPALDLRSALRVLPFALDPNSFKNGAVPVYWLTAVIRAIVIAWAVQRYRTRRGVAFSAGQAMTTALYTADGSDKDNDTVIVAGIAVEAAVKGENNAASYATQIFRDADVNAKLEKAFYTAANADCQFVESAIGDPDEQSFALLGQPLWGEVGMPEPMARIWERVSRQLQTEGLKFWQQYYLKRIYGVRSGFGLLADRDLQIQSRLLDQDDDWWERGLGPVTEDIEGWIEEQRELLRAADELAVLDSQQALNTIIDSSSPEFRTTADNKIDAGPNPEFDVPTLDHDLTELPAILRALIQTILTSLPNNTPPVVRSSLEGYEQHLLERGAQPIVGLVKAWMDAVRAEYASNDAELWGKGLDSLFQSTFEKHELLIEHFPLDEKREAAIASLEFDDAKAMGAEVIGALQNIGKALEALKEGQRTTEETDKVAAALKQQDDDYISLPISSPSILPDEDDELTPTSPRKRFAANRLALSERLYSLIGSTASISSSPAGQAALALLKRVLEVLRGLFNL